jgi:hypothetical protein
MTRNAIKLFFVFTFYIRTLIETFMLLAINAMSDVITQASFGDKITSLEISFFTLLFLMCFNLVIPIHYCKYSWSEETLTEGKMK